MTSLEAIIAITVALIAAVASVATGVITSRANSRAEKYQKERSEQEHERERRENEREHMEAATQTAMLAVLESLDVTLISLQGGHLNGNVEAARNDLAKAKRNFQETRSKAIAHLT